MRRALAALCLAISGSGFGCWPAAVIAADDAIPVMSIEAAYPEGPLWVGGDLLFAEMGRDRITRVAGNETRIFWEETGCGPTAITRFGDDGSFALNCHLAGKVVILGKDARKRSEITKGSQFRLRNPNDINSDGSGGVFFSDPGPFSPSLNPTGIVYRFDRETGVRQVQHNLKYPNGVAFDRERNTLFVSEHLAQRVWAFELDELAGVVNGAVIADRDTILAGSADNLETAGPDGLRLDDDGNLFIAVYGAGQVLVLSPQNRVHRVKVPMKFVTSIAISNDRIAITGAHSDRPGSYDGQVLIVGRQDFMSSNRIGF